MEKMTNVLVVTKNSDVEAGVGYDAFISTTYREVIGLLPNGQPMFGQGVGTRANSIGKAPEIGDFFAGKLVTTKTTPYEIGGNEVSKVTGVVFEGEDAVEVLNKALRRKGVQTASVILPSGKPSIDLQPKLDTTPIGAPQS